MKVQKNELGFLILHFFDKVILLPRGLVVKQSFAVVKYLLSMTLGF